MERGGDGVLFVAPAGEAVPRSWLMCHTNHHIQYLLVLPLCLKLGNSMKREIYLQICSVMT